VEAPLAVKPSVDPKQTVGVPGLIVKLGTGLMIGSTVNLDTQPRALVPETVYTVGAVGVTTTNELLLATGAQVKLKAVGETEVRVALLPGHIMVGLEVTVMLGPGSTVTVKTAEFVQLPEEPMAV
jgi:hypothetical protein